MFHQIISKLTNGVKAWVLFEQRASSPEKALRKGSVQIWKNVSTQGKLLFRTSITLYFYLCYYVCTCLKCMHMGGHVSFSAILRLNVFLSSDAFKGNGCITLASFSLFSNRTTETHLVFQNKHEEIMFVRLV